MSHCLANVTAAHTRPYTVVDGSSRNQGDYIKTTCMYGAWGMYTQIHSLRVRSLESPFWDQQNVGGELQIFLPINQSRRPLSVQSGRYPSCRSKTSHTRRPVLCPTTRVESATSLGTQLRPLLSRAKYQSTPGKNYPPCLSDCSTNQTTISTNCR